MDSLRIIVFIIILLYSCTNLNMQGLLSKMTSTNKKVYAKRQAIFGKGVKLIKGDIMSGIEKLQSENDSKCMPNSFYYNGSCIFVSKPNQKLSWIKAERLCRRLPLQSKFLIFENDHKFENVRKKLIRLRLEEDPFDPLKFSIGFRYTNEQWKWVNGKPLNATDLKLGKFWNDWNGSEGLCGSIFLYRSNKIEMRSTDCFTSSYRFMCEYEFNPCYQKDICGSHGKCINLYSTVYCECSIFYEGKYCQKLNSKGIQAIIGLVFIFLFMAIIICNNESFLTLWESFFGKNKRRQIRIESQRSVNWTSLSIKLKNNFLAIKEHFLKDVASRLVLIAFTLACTFIQVIFTIKPSHSHLLNELINSTHNLYIVKQTCKTIEQYYMFDDIIFLPFSLLFLIILKFSSKIGRFNKFIMNRFSGYFQTEFYKIIQENKKKKLKELVKSKNRKLLKSKCGRCKYISHKCCSHYLCSFFCCLCCCSCCVPPGSDTRCFLLYSLRLGWEQTSWKKVLDAIIIILKWIFLIPLWRCLWKLTRKNRESTGKKNNTEKIKSYTTNENESIDSDEVIDEDDFNSYDQTIHRFKAPCPFPSTPFSTSNRAQSAAVYAIYTYDVLNIFMYVYTLSLTPKMIPFLGNIGTPGIILDLVIQIIQVIIVGVKFYPILVVADSDPGWLIYLFSSFYMLIIWTSWLFRKAFCSRSEAFVRQAFQVITNQFAEQINFTIGLQKNITNLVLAFFTDQDDASEKYIDALKSKVPKLFDEYFGNQENKSSFFPLESMDDYDSSLKYYSKNFNLTTTQSSFISASSSYTNSLRNKTFSKIDKFEDKILNIGSTKQFDLVEFFEIFPLYFLLSYLLSSHFLKFLSDFYKSLSSFLRPKILLNSYWNDDMYKIAFKQLKMPERKLKLENHNILYINSFFRNTITFENLNVKLADKRYTSKIVQRYEISFIWGLIESKIYKNVHYFRYSKQFVNTYTVAFMVIYFICLFGLQLSNVLGEKFVNSIEKLYILYLRSISPFLNARDHNLTKEINICIIIASIFMSIQLLLSIKNYRKDVLRLHKGEKFFRSLVLQYKDEDYKTFIRKRNNTSADITTDSLHFPGFLIAHLVYGYIILVLMLLGIMIVIKIFYYLSKTFQMLLQIFFPIIILFILKSTFLKFLVRWVLLKSDRQRISNIAPYFLISYFNFFFDCFLGLFACVSRVWKTTLFSIIYLPRLDKSMFDKENEFLIRKIDKGHLAYINQVRMEHWYNNNMLNGFCEILIESMLFSQFYEEKFNRKSLMIISKCKKKSLANYNFKFKSFLRLRNLIFLYFLLKKNSFLVKYRYAFLHELRYENQKNPKFSKIEGAKEFLNSRLNKIICKLGLKY